MYMMAGPSEKDIETRPCYFWRLIFEVDCQVKKEPFESLLERFGIRAIAPDIGQPGMLKRLSIFVGKYRDNPSGIYECLCRVPSEKFRVAQNKRVRRIGFEIA